jgi:hypothetical protein
VRLDLGHDVLQVTNAVGEAPMRLTIRMVAGSEELKDGGQLVPALRGGAAPLSAPVTSHPAAFSGDRFKSAAAMRSTHPGRTH